MRACREVTAAHLRSKLLELQDAISALTVPPMLVRGMAAGSVVGDDAEKELLARQPAARVEHVEGAGHSIQGDRPVELARLIHSFIP